jgi:hydrocephalus-inducing protein
LDSDDSYDAAEAQAKLERRKQRAVATLNRKYLSIRKAVEEDKMLFQDEIFQIEPLEGKIWPNTEMTCCVTFRPQGPYHYSCTAFANVTCSQERLALNLTGQGKGPQAQLSITEMDIGDIFVTNQKSFELGIENTGEIDCHWKLIPYETPFGSKFNFSKTDGTLGVREHVRDLLRVTFMSDILGEFSETFRFALEGSSEMLTLTFKGHVVAPTFRFSEDTINFGKVSYKFPETKTVYLENTSEVDINYVVRVPGDGRSVQNEFNIQNDRGRLAKDSMAEIVIEFIPCVPHVYDMVLVVDLEGVGQDMLAVPIKAECIVPKVRVQPNEFLQFDNCFLKHPKTKQIQIVNEDNLRARFEIQPQDEQSKRVATYKVDKWSGVIEPHSTQTVDVTLQTEILGPVRTNFVVKLDGHNIPVMMLILASSGGPDVKLDRSELDFGQVTVLEDRRMSFKISNIGQIDAEYTAFTKNKDSIWKVIERYGVIRAKEEKSITVSCLADEVQRFQDTLHIIVNNGMDVEV